MQKDQILLEDLYSGIYRKRHCADCGCQLTKENTKYLFEGLEDETQMGTETPVESPTEPSVSNSVDQKQDQPQQPVKKSNCNGVIIYHGKNKNHNIVAIATGLVNPSDNRKTGPMIQIWILNADLNPVEAIASGADESVCGDCMHRKSKGGACYVNPGQAPNRIWKSFKEGGYPYIVDPKLFESGNIESAYINNGNWDMFKNYKVRFGAYGDPSFIPLAILQKIASNCKGYTGYTHQWKRTDPGYKQFLTASVDFPWEYELAKKLGWKTFRVAVDWNKKAPNEIPCLNSSQGKQCADCLLCSGTSRGGKDIYIKVHGSTAKRFIELFGTEEDTSTAFDQELTASDKRHLGMVQKREDEDAAQAAQRKAELKAKRAAKKQQNA